MKGEPEEGWGRGAREGRRGPKKGYMWTLFQKWSLKKLVTEKEELINGRTWGLNKGGLTSGLSRSSAARKSISQWPHVWAFWPQVTFLNVWLLAQGSWHQGTWPPEWGTALIEKTAVMLRFQTYSVFPRPVIQPVLGAQGQGWQLGSFPASSGGSPQAERACGSDGAKMVVSHALTQEAGRGLKGASQKLTNVEVLPFFPQLFSVNGDKNRLNLLLAKTILFLF